MTADSEIVPTSSAPIAISVPSVRGRRVDLLFHTPVESGPRPVVLAAPSLSWDGDAHPLPTIARALAGAGFVVACVGRAAVREAPTLREAIADLGAALDALSERATLDTPGSGFRLAERLDPRRIGLLGHGLGATAAVLLARRDSRVCAVLAAAAPAAPASLFKEEELASLASKGNALVPSGAGDVTVDARFLSDWRARAAELDLAAAAEALSVPLLLVHAGGDERVPEEDARRAYFRQASLGRLAIVETADHGFSGEGARRLAETAVPFFRGTLAAKRSG